MESSIFLIIVLNYYGLTNSDYDTFIEFEGDIVLDMYHENQKVLDFSS